jgi:diaminopimelate decarboxylase
VIVNAVRLPELAPGDVLAIMDSGAYFEPDSTVFSFARPGTLLVDGDELTVARRAETLDDVTARDAY